MNLAELSRIDLSAASVSTLLNLPPPESSDLTGTTKQLVAAMNNLFGLWRQVLVDKAALPLDRYESSSHGHKHQWEGDDVRGRLLLVVCGYFDHLVFRYIVKETRKNVVPLPDAFRLADFRRLIPQGEPTPETVRWTQFGLLSFNYVYTVFALHFSRVFRGPLPRPLVSKFEEFSHTGLSDLFASHLQVTGEHERIAARRLVQGAIDIAKEIYSDPPTWNSQHPLGAFSAIRLDELALLARRDASLKARYGTKNVEKVFEHQLALVMQSFGLYVVSTRTGYSTVDLVCISGSAEERTTFLIEAKTTSGRYSLPTKDSRALRDYVSDVRRSLSTLPPLSYVLLVAFEPSPTMAAKIARLEADASVPVRFVRAQQLATLRERIPGPLPLRVFSSSVLTGEAVLGESFVDAVVRSYEAEQRAHRTFVESMLSARGVLPAARAWSSLDSEPHPEQH